MTSSRTRITAGVVGILMVAAASFFAFRHHGHPHPVASPTPTPTATVACPSGATLVSLTQDLAATVAAAPQGTTFCLAAGTYRLAQPVVPQASDTIIGAGEGVTFVRGDKAIPAANWHQTGALWTDTAKDVSLAPPTLDTTDCANGTTSCDYLDDLSKVTGGTALKRVLAPCGTNVVAGTYCIDYPHQTIYMKDNPASFGGVTYATTSQGFSAANGVTLSDMTVEHFAGTAVGLGPTSVGDHLELAFAHVGGASLGTHATLESSHVHDNGYHGIGGPADGITFTDNEVDHNGGGGYDGGTGTGGAKFSTGQGYTITGNAFHDNWGNGLWFDVGANGATVSDNTMTANHVILSGTRRNGGNGLRIEVSCNIAATGNTFSGNDQAGASVTDAAVVTLAANTVSGNANGISFAADLQRGPSNTCNPTGLPRVASTGLVATGNTISMTTGTSGYRLTSVSLDAASRFDANVYHVPSCASAFWTIGSPKGVAFAAWQAAGQDPAGSCGP